MININHPKVHGKPPVNKPTPVQHVGFKQRSIAKQNVVRKEEDINAGRTAAIKMDQVHCDENVTGSTARSFEQLCNMINDLERNIINEIPSIDCRSELEAEKDNSGGKCDTNGTTYDDIMSFLTKLEEDDCLNEAKLNMPRVNTASIDLDPAAVHPEMLSYPQVLPCDSCNSLGSNNIKNSTRFMFQEHLATLQLQLEEKNATISLLKEQLKSERKLACEKLDTQRRSNVSKLQQQEKKYKEMVKRHQKFIEQLLAEKTDLTEKCNSLVQRVKENDIKMQRALKVAADRQTTELQRAKEHFAAAEKIKRERWIEARTTKIKEMTVKGLEPELRNMMEQHAEEIQRLKHAHTKELQDVELRTTRRLDQQLQQLRLELTASHEKILNNEKNILCTRYKEKLEQQENQFEEQRTKLLKELQLERDKFNKEQAKHDAEREASLQKVHRQYQQEIQILEQQHSNKKKALEELLKTEWEGWLADYKKQQNLKIHEAEKKIRDECNEERDRQIELAIERLEKDSRNAQQILQENFDCKLRSLKEKFQTELRTAIDKEEFYKKQLTSTKDKLDKIEIQLRETENQLKQHVSELNSANEIIKQSKTERDHAKKLARYEIEGEKRELEQKITSLYQEITYINNNTDASMRQLHSRIKLIMTQKILKIKTLTKELHDAKLQCERLEQLLDQQRREYILKGL